MGLALGAAAHLAHADLVIKDDTGQEVRLKGPAKRIITLAPHAAESLFAAGAGDKLVGTVDYSDYPPEAKNCHASVAIRALIWRRWPP